MTVWREPRTICARPTPPVRTVPVSQINVTATPSLRIRTLSVLGTMSARKVPQCICYLILSFLSPYSLGSKKLKIIGQIFQEIPFTYCNITKNLLSLNVSPQDCVCQPRFPEGCTCDPFSPDPNSACPAGQECSNQCRWAFSQYENVQSCHRRNVS